MRILHLLPLLLSLHASAQLPVRLEPHHHNVFENDRVRVLNVFFGPRDTSFYHLHSTPSVFVELTATLTGSQLYGQQSDVGRNVAGRITYDPMLTTRYHRVWNADTTWFHVMDIELPGQPSGLNPKPLTGPGIKSLFSEAQANGYHLDPKAGDKIQLPPNPQGYVFVSLGDAEVRIATPDGQQHLFMKAGHFQWLNSKGTTTLTFPIAAPMGFGIIQLK